MKVWFVAGLVSCWGPSLVARRLFIVRPFGVFSQGFDGVLRTCLSERVDETVYGFSTLMVLASVRELYHICLLFVIHKLAGHPSNLSSQHE